MDRSTLFVHRYQYSGCLYCSAVLCCVRRHTFECCYHEHCVEEECSALKEWERSTSVRSPEWNSSGDDGNVARTADEWTGEEKSERVMKGERSVLKFCFSFAEPAVPSERKAKRHEARKLRNVTFDVFLEAKELCPRAEKLLNRKRLATERAQDVLRREGSWKMRLRRAGDSPPVSADFYQKNILKVLKKQMLSTASAFHRSENVPAERTQYNSINYSKTIERTVRD